MPFLKQRQKIYLDYAATTPVDARVFAKMKPYLTDLWGNSRSLHQFGKNMAQALENARETIATALDCAPSEIYFTSSATEANNTVLKGVAFSNEYKGKHIIISQVEHASVYETANYLSQLGFEITRIPVVDYGRVDLQALKDVIRSDTILISVMHVNNETGTIQPIEDIARICKEKGVLFHTDASQSFGKLPLSLHRLPVDFLTASSHKIYGPLGAGLLFVRRGRSLVPLLHGGQHESGVRASTVNIPAVVGFAEAVEIYKQEREEERRKLQAWKEEIIAFLQQHVEKIRINTPPEDSVYHILNFSVAGADSELLQMALDQKGIAVSTGSACSSGRVKESRILKACGVPSSFIRGTIRVSLGRFTTQEEVSYFCKTITELIKQVRKIS